MIGAGSRVKRVTDELVVKGQVSAETFSPATVTWPDATSKLYTDATNNRSVRDASLTTITRSMAGNTTVLNQGRGDWAYLRAFVTPASSLPGPFATTTKAGSSTSAVGGSAFSLDIDGMSMTIILVDNATTLAPIIIGHNIWVNYAAAASDSAGSTDFTLAEVVIAVNSAVSAYASAQGLSAALVTAYGSCASAGTNGLTITSQVDGLASDVRVYAGFGTNLNTLLFGGALDASTYIQLSASAYGSAATFTITYAATVDSVDALANTPTTLRSIGSSPGRADYIQTEDWTLSGANLTWAPAAATLTSSVASTALAGPTTASTGTGYTNTSHVQVVTVANTGYCYNAYYSVFYQLRRR